MLVHIVLLSSDTVAAAHLMINTSFIFGASRLNKCLFVLGGNVILHLILS